METIKKEFLDPRSLSPREFLEKIQACGMTLLNARRLLGAVVGNGELDPADWAAAGILPRKTASALLPLPRLELEKVVTSPVDGFKKALFRTHDGLSVETVIIPLHKENAASICLSSQVGCVMGCVFCATARMTERRNLKTWEIVDQFRQARAIAAGSGRRVTGAVFMGMGEPFLNYGSVLAAAELLSFPVANAIRSKAITISTVGLVREIARYTCERRPYRLSISLGAATDAKRKELVPVAARTPVREVMAAASAYAAARNDRVNLAYVCIGGFNVFEEDARALADLVGGTRVRLDLIEVTDPTGRFKRPSPDELNSFRDALSKFLKQPVVRRYSGGADINAACGTLAGSP